MNVSHALDNIRRGGVVNMEQKYELEIVDVYEAEKASGEDYLNYSHSRHTGIRTNTVEKLKEIIRIAEIVGWRILDMSRDSLSGVVVEESPVVAEIDSRHKQEREDFHTKQRMIVDKINQLPTEKKLREYLTADGQHNLEIFVTRTVATYNPQKSHRISCATSICCRIDGGEMKDLRPWQYISESGSVLKKKFVVSNDYGPMNNFVLWVTEDLKWLESERQNFIKVK